MPSGGPFFPLVPDPIYELYAADFGHSEPQKQKAIYYNGYTYVGGVSGDSGDVVVGIIQNGSLTTTAVKVLHAALGGGEGNPDMHDNPGLEVDPTSHKLIAIYTAHADTVIRIRVSTNSLDADPTISGGFASEATFDPSTGVYDYPAMHWMGNTLYVFYRSIPSGSVDAHLKYVTASSPVTTGSTFSAATDIYNNPGATAYWSTQGNGTDTIHVLTFNDNEGSVTNNDLKHFTMTAAGFFQTDGDEITASLPLAPADIDTIPSTGGHHLFGLELYDEGPGFTCSRRVSGVFQVVRIFWDGDSWDVSQITTSSGVYSWGNGLDPENRNRALVTRWSGGVADLWEFTYSGSWSAGTQLSPGAGDDWLWPIFVHDAGPNISAIVLYGTYTTYLNFEFALWGVS